MSSTADPHDRLDALIVRSLAECAQDLRRAPWFGRENELVNLFVFSHLLRLALLTPAVLEPGQIGIVIWPAPRTTCWAGPRLHGVPPWP